LDVRTNRRRWAHELHLEYLDVRIEGRGGARGLHLEYVDVRTAGEGERVNSVLSTCMSEKIEDGERRVESMLNIWMSEHGAYHKHLAT